MNWRWVSLTATLAAVVIGYGTLVERDTTPTHSDQMPQQPGYYLKDALVTRFNEDGSAGMVLSARHIEQQYSAGQRTERITLEDVQMDYYSAGQQAANGAWALTARHGEVPAESQVVNLSGDVRLRSLSGRTDAVLSTDSLAIDTASNIAYSTSSPVNLRFGQHTLSVDSLRADLNQEQLQLEGVHGRFDPQP